jgi:thiamine pyrophosphate-dependent acetolactate synthase large subunit-like protein
VRTAASMGLPAVRDRRATDIADAVETSIKSARPSLIEVPIDAKGVNHLLIDAAGLHSGDGCQM